MDNVELNDAEKELLSKLEFAIDNMSQLFHDLLDVSKLEARLEHVKLAPVFVKPLLDRVFHEFDALANDKNLTLRFHVRALPSRRSCPSDLCALF